MNCEGLMLLVLTVPLVLVFILNMLYFDMLDTIRLPYTWWRFAVTFGGAYLLMAGMISTRHLVPDVQGGTDETGGGVAL